MSLKSKHDLFTHLETHKSASPDMLFDSVFLLYQMTNQLRGFACSQKQAKKYSFRKHLELCILTKVQ